MDVRAELETRAARFGRWRVLDGRLCVPVAQPLDEQGGYYESAGSGAWEWRDVAPFIQIHDLAVVGDATFAAGSLEGRAVVARREQGGAPWQLEELNEQAARFSYRAAAFLAGPDHLALLCIRDVLGEWPPRTAPPAWGAWYALNYFPQRSERGFLFDGQPRPLPVLRALAADTALLQNRNFGVARDTRWGDELLYTVMGEELVTADPDGALFRAAPADCGPQAGTCFKGARIPDTQWARDVAVEGDTCAVLLAENAKNRARVLSTRDLDSWIVRFEGELSAPATALELANGEFIIGLADGGLVVLTGEAE